MQRPTTAATPANRPQTVATRQPTPDQVAQRAYQLFLARGGEHGHALEDWVQAEKELRGKATGS